MIAQTKSEWFDPEETTFGDRLAGARELSGMDKAQLARRLGVKEKTLEKWENDHSEPRANRLSMLAGLLNVSILWLLTGEGEGPALSETRETGHDLGEVLAEIQALNGVMSACGDRLNRLERRVEAALTDA